MAIPCARLDCPVTCMHICAVNPCCHLLQGLSSDEEGARRRLEQLAADGKARMEASQVRQLKPCETLHFHFRVRDEQK